MAFNGYLGDMIVSIFKPMAVRDKVGTEMTRLRQN